MNYRKKLLRGKRKVSMLVGPENCYGDFYFHKICPIKDGVMICKLKLMENENA